jgi:hypothetical protein
MGNTKTSAVWNYFEAEGNGAKCLIENCREPNIGSIHAGNLKKHLKFYHDTVYNEVQAKDAEVKEEKKKTSTNQSKLQLVPQPKTLSKQR